MVDGVSIDIENKLINSKVSILADKIAYELSIYYSKTKMHENNVVERLRNAKDISDNKVLSEEMSMLLIQREIKIRNIFEQYEISIDYCNGLEKKLLERINKAEEIDKTIVRLELSNTMKTSFEESLVIKNKIREEIQKDIPIPFKIVINEKGKQSNLTIDEQKKV